MGNIITSPAPRCSACGSGGFPLQTNVTDPDGIIPGEWLFRKCSSPNCGLIWLDPAPLETELWKAYASYHTHTRNPSNRAERLIFSLANRLARAMFSPVWAINGLRAEAEDIKFMTLKNMPAGRLLDVGCGGGRFMKRMKRLGWEVEGIDFDANATNRIASRYGMKTYTGDLVANRIPGNSFDAITLSHVIEHLADPEKTLRECLNLLKPGGRLIVVTPNAECMGAKLFGPHWRGWEPPRHLHLFSTMTLTGLLGKAGFNLDKVRTSAAGAAVIYRVSRTNQAKNAGPVSVIFKLWLVFWSYWKELSEFRSQKSNPHAGQNLLALASRPIHHTP